MIGEEKKAIVYCSIEHKEREFVPKLLLSGFLIQRGFRVILGSSEAVFEMAKKSAPGVFLHKSPHPRSRELRQLGHRFVVLDEETGPTIPAQNLEAVTQRTYKNSKAETQDLILLYSKAYAQITSRLTHLKGIRQLVTGWPRFDLFKPKMRAIFDKQVDEIKREYGDFLLFPTSFGGSSKERLHKILEESDTPTSREETGRRIKFFDTYVDFVRSLSTILPEGLRIILRPHPSERSQQWRETFAGIKNIEVEGKGDSTPWILASRCTVQMGSTLSLASFALNKPTFIPTAALQHLGPSLANDVCIPVRDPQDLIDELAKPSKNLLRTVAKTSVNKFLKDSLIDSPAFSSELVASAISDLRLKTEARPVAGLSIKAKCGVLHYGSAIKTRYLKFRRQFSGEKTIYENLRGGLSGEECADILGQMSRILFGSRPFSVKVLAQNLIMIDGLEPSNHEVPEVS